MSNHQVLVSWADPQGDTESPSSHLTAAVSSLNIVFFPAFRIMCVLVVPLLVAAVYGTRKRRFVFYAKNENRANIYIYTRYVIHKYRR